MLAPHPDRNGKTGLQEVTDVQPLLFLRISDDLSSHKPITLPKSLGMPLYKGV